ncbi:hypothetical protein ACHWQZ_G003602 [Mnemiopsis leidyi]
MILLLLASVCLVSAVPDRHMLESPGRLNAEFKRFEAAQGRNYGPGEIRFRLRVFRDNLKKIVECNERQGSYTCAENMFTDLTDSERSAYTGLQNVTDNNFSSSPLLSSVAAPDSKDWRDHNAVTGVKNQGQCGSCWTFSAIGAIEGAYSVATNVLKVFSEQELLDCTYETMYPGYDGCNGGWYYDSFNYVKESGRLAREASYPYRANDGGCNMGSVANDLGTARLTGYVQVEKGDDNLAGALAISPVSIAMLSNGDFYSYRSGIYDGEGDCQCNWSPNHALTAVAYAPDHFVIKNSWGRTWGDGGYIKLARGLKNTVCRLADFAYYPQFSADGTEPTLPPTQEPFTTQVGPTDDNDGCPSGTTRCPDGTCKHIHMC